MSTVFITEEQWKLIDKKWDKLFRKISHQIKGDNKLDPEDIYQDLKVQVYYIFSAYIRKTGREIDDFLKDPEFNKYFKTCLWNYKNNVGANVQKRYHINGEFVDNNGGQKLPRYNIFFCENPAGNQEDTIDILGIEAPPAYEILEITDFVDNFGYGHLFSEDRAVLRELVQNPQLFSESTGRLMYSKISEATKIPSHRVEDSMDRIRSFISKEYR